MKMKWDETGERLYETGVDHGVVYPMTEAGTYGKGAVFNGLTSVNENPSGAESNDTYADNIKYLSMTSAEKFGYTIGAYYSPEEFDECDGTKEIAPGVTIGQQNRKAFGFSYRTLLGNDVLGTDYGYVLHLVYNSKCQPSQKNRSTVNENPEAAELSWECNTTPVTVNVVDGSGKPYKPTAHLQINSKRVDATKLAQIEALLYGTDDTYATFSGSEFESGTDYYELVDGAYVVTEDVTPQTGKTYYTKTASGTDGKFLTPDEVYKILNSNG